MTAPTLCLWGVHDPWQTISDGERLAREIPNARLVRVWKMHRTIHLRDSQSRCATFSPLVESTQKSDAAGHVRGRDSSEGESGGQDCRGDAARQSADEILGEMLAIMRECAKPPMSGKKIEC